MKPVQQAPSYLDAGPPAAEPSADPAGAEAALADALADVMHVGHVGVDSHFFDDLGADSLVMAQFCARIRKRQELPSISMKDVYRHSTVRSLAVALAERAPEPAPVAPVAPPERAAPTRISRYILCGSLQLLSFLGYSYLVAFFTVWGYGWIADGPGGADVYLRSVLFGLVGFVGLCALPVVVKWSLIGRWRPQRIDVWSLAYVRFWIVKTLVRSNPLVLFVGSPVYLLYLRALGARIGKGAAIFSRNVPICTDLLTIGDGAVIRKDSFFSCYTARAGVIRTGAVTLGRGAVVSEATVLDIDTSLGAGAQLGHASSLHSGQAVPDGERWHGSPAQRAEADYLAVGPAPCGAARRALHGVLQLLAVLLVYVPLVVGGAGALLAAAPQVAAILEPGSAALTGWTFYADALVASLVLFFGAVPAGLFLMATVPRLLNRTITPGRVYPLYGFHYGVHRAITLVTNRKFMNRLFGDSSAVVHHLRGLGYDLGRVEQTGSNFGTDLKHESPFLSSVGRGTMVADGLSVNNADFSSSSFRVARTSIGASNFLGNKIAYPSRGRTGDNCLLATKVMVPVDGRIREGVGLLGSPSFEIPRTVLRDRAFDELRSGDGARGLLAAKNRHNAGSMVLYLLVRWFYFFFVTLLFSIAAELHSSVGVPAFALANVLVVFLGAVYFVLVERSVTKRHPPGPLFCSIYDPRFWQRERYWKVPSETYLQIFSGTPFKTMLWRLLGVRIGSRVFDDGCALTERRMVSIGDGSTLNAGSVVQCHSQEDGAFKSDRSVIGSHCTLGVGAFVHYGTTIGPGAFIGADSFLMKGEVVPQDARWAGNPARQSRQSNDDEGRQDP